MSSVTGPTDTTALHQSYLPLTSASEDATHQEAVLSSITKVIQSPTHSSITGDFKVSTSTKQIPYPILSSIFIWHKDCVYKEEMNRLQLTMYCSLKQPIKQMSIESLLTEGTSLVSSVYLDFQDRLDMQEMFSYGDKIGVRFYIDSSPGAHRIYLLYEGSSIIVEFFKIFTLHNSFDQKCQTLLDRSLRWIKVSSEYGDTMIARRRSRL